MNERWPWMTFCRLVDPQATPSLTSRRAWPRRLMAFPVPLGKAINRLGQARLEVRLGVAWGSTNRQNVIQGHLSFIASTHLPQAVQGYRYSNGSQPGRQGCLAPKFSQATEGANEGLLG